MAERLSDHQVWALEELDRNGPGKNGRELFEERGHGAFTLDSFIRRGFYGHVEGVGLDLTPEGRAALASVPKERLGRPNPRKARPA